MGWLHLYTSAHIGLGAYNRADGIARDLQGSNEQRTLTQLRADVVSDLLIDGVVGNREEFGIRFPPRCGRFCNVGTALAANRAATGPLCVAISTTPRNGSTAARPPTTIWLIYAKCITTRSTTPP
jgi:hypothetical protein